MAMNHLKTRRILRHHRSGIHWKPSYPPHFQQSWDCSWDCKKLLLSSCRASNQSSPCSCFCPIPTSKHAMHSCHRDPSTAVDPSHIQNLPSCPCSCQSFHSFVVQGLLPQKTWRHSGLHPYSTELREWTPWWKVPTVIGPGSRMLILQIQAHLSETNVMKNFIINFQMLNLTTLQRKTLFHSMLRSKIIFYNSIINKRSISILSF